MFFRGSDLHYADRWRLDGLGYAVWNLYHYLVQHLGYEDLLQYLIAEVWRVLAQRPIQVAGVKHMVTQIAVCLRDDPGMDVYAERCAAVVEHLTQRIFWYKQVSGTIIRPAGGEESA